jgi:hypothetical protein
MSAHAPQPIATDLLCIACQYNLRTRSTADVCPECGLPVAQTVDHRQKHAGAVRNVQRLRVACWWLAIPSLLCPVYVAGLLTLLHFQRPGMRPPTAAEILARDAGQLALVATLLVGVLCFLSAVGTQVVSAARRSTATMLAISFSLLTVVSVLGSFSLLLRRGPWRWTFGLSLIRNQRLAATFICLLLAIEGYLALRQLARALAEPRLAAVSRLVFTGFIAQQAASLAIYLILMTWWPRRNWLLFQNIFNGLDVVGAAFSLAFGIYWLYVARVLPRHKPPLPELPPPPLLNVSSQEKVEAFLARRRPPPP